MKSRQLANVLIKILGLSTAVHCVPGVITGFWNVTRSAQHGGPKDFWFYPVSSIALGLLGVVLIMKSREIAACLFKEEE